MLNRLRFQFVTLSLMAFLAVGSPSLLHAQKAAPTTPAGQDVGQQGEFDGEHTDTGAAALDNPNEKEVPEVPEATEKAETVASSAAVSAPSEAPDSSTDLDRIEDQKQDQQSDQAPDNELPNQ